MCQSIATAEQPTHLDHIYRTASATSLASEIKMTYQKMKIRDGPYHGIAIRAQERPAPEHRPHRPTALACRLGREYCWSLFICGAKRAVAFGIPFSVRCNEAVGCLL